MARRLVVIVALAGCCLSGCGNAPSGVSTPTPTVATTPASQTPTPEAKPLSPFEDQAPVKAVRRLFYLEARSVNRRKLDLPGLGAVLTPAGRRLLDPQVRTDFGQHYPGPIPFTPTRVAVTGASAKVLGCMVGQGFALDPKTGEPAGRRHVYPIRIGLVRVHANWKVDSLYSDSGRNCRTVKVSGVTW